MLIWRLLYLVIIRKTGDCPITVFFMSMVTNFIEPCKLLMTKNKTQMYLAFSLKITLEWKYAKLQAIKINMPALGGIQTTIMK